jgi:hypothetical protein
MENELHNGRRHELFLFHVEPPVKLHPSLTRCSLVIIEVLSM